MLNKPLASPAVQVAQHPAVPPDALAEFLSLSRPWRNHPVPLSARLTRALWSLIGTEIVVGSWLYAVVRGRSRCSGPLCSTATLGGHPAVAFGLSISCFLILLGLSTVTRGLTQAGAVHLAVIAVSALAGLIAVIGALMVLALVVLAFAVFVAVLLGITAAA